MFKFSKFNGAILALCFFLLLDCASKKRPSLTSNVANDEEIKPPPSFASTNGTDKAIFQPIEKIAATSLDDPKFQILNMAIGLQTLLNSETIVLNFSLPKDADYAEIIRCSDQADFSAVGTGTKDIHTLAASGMSRDQLSQYFKSNDIFRGASENTRYCELVSEGAQTNPRTPFVDAWAPSGSFFYIARACITQERLVNAEKLTNRNCSKQLGISKIQYQYVNSRSDELKELYRKKEKALAKIDQLSSELRYVSNASVQAFDECAIREKKRAIETQLRKSIIQVADAVLEGAIELRSSGKKLTSYLPFGKAGFIDKIQMVQAAEGLMFGPALQSMFASSRDMPRDCTLGMSYYKRIEPLHDQIVQDAGPDYISIMGQIETQESANDAASGQKSQETGN